MKRSFHVWKRPLGVKAYVVQSYDTYEEARELAEVIRAQSCPDTLLEIAQAGRLVWGPYLGTSRLARCPQCAP